MNNQYLNALTSLDGRYAAELTELSEFLSESALIRYRVRVEAQWLLFLASEKTSVLELRSAEKTLLETLAIGSVSDDALHEIKKLERVTSHDVKAVEYWLRTELIKCGASDLVLSHIHFACTSEDINNAAYGLMLKDFRSSILAPMLEKLIDQIFLFAEDGASCSMISRTHGQTASPTTIGKEMAVFGYRLNRQLKRINSQVVLAKFNGAVGNYNAHHIAYPQMDWLAASKVFVEESLGLVWNPLTTQIESHDALVELMQAIQLLNSILIDFTRDMWGYISLGYFSQKAVKGEVGSSTMPHKVNPIYFENAEGNLGLANSLSIHFAEKLPVSRWQRDLSDSTVMRSLGACLGHSLLAYKNIQKGLLRVEFDKVKMQADLDVAWEVLAEAVQSVMRRYGVLDAYERLKKATRGAPAVTRELIFNVVDDCSEMPLEEKKRLKSMKPHNYLGYAKSLAEGKFGE